MKPTIYSLIFALLILSACGKKENTTTTPVTPAEDNSYILTGVTDMTIGNIDSGMMPLALTHKSGDQKKITFSTNGLPDGITAYFEPVSGIVPFATILRLATNMPKAGSYSIKLITTPESGKAKEFSFTINVQNTADCIDYFRNATTSSRIAGNLKTYAPGSTTLLHADVLLDYYSTEKAMYLSNVYMEVSSPRYISTGNTYHVKVNVDCANHTLTIPEQQVSGSNGTTTKSYTINGNGSFDVKNKTYEINYTTVSSGLTSNFVLKGPLK